MTRIAIDSGLDYIGLAQIHRPTDPLALAAEIRRLRKHEHLTPRDISVALRLDIAAVLNALHDDTIITKGISP